MVFQRHQNIEYKNDIYIYIYKIRNIFSCNISNICFLLIRVLEEKIKKDKKCLANSIENTYVHSPNKKDGFLIYELFKEKYTESSVVKRVLRAIKG